MKKLLEVLVCSLVDDPEAVKIGQVDEEAETVYTISVAQDDMGKVIGKQGKIANAIRTLVKAAATKSKTNVYVKILDND
ncbi:MAG: KH domain-containing protein [Abditibacteriota bacterium]|nr:KH domain-containing protein [Abditibacteriota bacterium]MBP5093235.1 KH domain-containing protein [Abditibacteriota bacterium]MBP5718148.1 KH domain-containing protein [Abditibacteriota bacterium]MBP5738587.1 KH domain-containing protein [Abditibacteriota bacterium]MBQ7525510.1 KH domain-containing protein [Abditibacteriota bacterium]